MQSIKQAKIIGSKIGTGIHKLKVQICNECVSERNNRNKKWKLKMHISIIYAQAVGSISYFELSWAIEWAFFYVGSVN